jgi:antitoxin component of MazEF toxin-antitoxin module
LAVWVAEGKLNKHGNSTAVTIPRSFLYQLGWLTGRKIIVELNDDRTECVIRLPRHSDYGVVGPPSIHREIDVNRS